MKEIREEELNKANGGIEFGNILGKAPKYHRDQHVWFNYEGRVLSIVLDVEPDPRVGYIYTVELLDWTSRLALAPEDMLEPADR